jgi:tRNA(Leu) C34 or U34 (ribose-2'-O)-methylase TrmL
VQTNYAEGEYQEGDSFLFGPETRGLPQAILDRFKGITLPMQVLLGISGSNNTKFNIIFYFLLIFLLLSINKK